MAEPGPLLHAAGELAGRHQHRLDLVNVRRALGRVAPPRSSGPSSSPPPPATTLPLSSVAPAPVPQQASVESDYWSALRSAPTR